MTKWKVKYVSDNMEPHYETTGSAGFDLVAAEDVYLKPGFRALVSTGLRIELPLGCVGMVCPRSGLALKHGVTVLNAPGIVDCDYRGEVGVILINHCDKGYQVKKGDRVAQMVLTGYMDHFEVEFDKVDRLSDTKRGGGGFGSTGKRSGCWNPGAENCDCPACGGFND